MKKLVLIFSLFLFGNLASHGQTLDEYWEFTNLYAADDALGVTHLFYAQTKTRVHNCSDGYDYGIVKDHTIIHRYYNATTGTDSIFIPMHDNVVMPGCYGGGGVSISDFHPFDGNPEHVLFSGGYSDGFEPYGYLQVGNHPFYLAPLFVQLPKVEANPNLGNFIFLPLNEYTLRVPLTENQDTIRVLNENWYTWRDANWDDYNPIDSLNGYFKGYDYNLLSLSRFNDSLSFYQKNGSIIRSENLGRTGDTLDIGFPTNSIFSYDADSLHIYITHKGSSSVLVSDEYGKPGGWNSVNTPSPIRFYTVDAEAPGMIFYADSNRIYKTENFASTFSLEYEFEEQINGLYKKPGADVLFVLLENKLLKIDSGEIITIREVPKTKTFRIDREGFPYLNGNEFVFRIYQEEVLSENSSRYVPTEDFKMQVSEVRHSTETGEIQEINFENSSNRPLFSKITFGRNDKVFVSPWREKGNQILVKDNQTQYKPWVNSQYNDSLIQLGIIREIRRSYYFDNYDTTSYINYYTTHTSDSTSKIGEQIAQINWSNKFGIKSVDFWQDSLLYSLKGAVIQGEVFGDTTITLIVSNEPNTTEIPKKITVAQNYPNPFNPSTVISYQLNSNQLVRLEVFDVTGRKVAILVDGKRKSAGTYRVSFDGSGLASGMYFYRLQAGGQTFTQKMMLLK